MREKALAVLAALATVLNLVDAVATLYWVEAGLATEANPVMDTLLSSSPLAFMVGKLSMVSLGVYYLYQHREALLARVGLCTAGGAYSALAAYHGLAAVML